MEKIYIRYHIVGNRVNTEEKKFENFGTAVAMVATKIKERDVIAAVRNSGHVIEIKTNYITYHEVMTESENKKREKLMMI